MNKDSIPTVSVVMITYNHEYFIAEAIEGVLMQDVDFNVELVIVDDCSPDGTKEIVQKFIKNHPKGHWIKYHCQEENIGMMPNFIFALKEAKGEYIALCDGDDYWTSKDKLMKQVDFLKNQIDYSMCFHNVSMINDGEIIRNLTNKNRNEFSTVDLFNKHFIGTSSILYRNNIDLPDWIVNISSGDKALLLIISTYGNFKFLNETMSHYRIHSGGVSNTHIGIKKVYETSTLLNLFNQEYNYKYTELCHSSLEHEIEVHVLPKYINEIKTLTLIKEIIIRMKKKLIGPFKKK